VDLAGFVRVKVGNLLLFWVHVRCDLCLKGSWRV
jgi:hypothetical protein